MVQKKIPEGKIKTFVETSKPWSIFPDMFMCGKLHLLGAGEGGRVKSPVFELTEFVDEPLGSCHVSKEASVCFAKFYPLPSVGNYQNSIQTLSLQISKSEHFLE